MLCPSTGRSPLARHTAILMAIVTFFSPVAFLRAQTPTGEARAGFETKYITPETAVVAYFKPQQIMTSPKSEMLPRELATTAGLELLGIDPAKVTEVVFVLEPPHENGPPLVGFVFSLSEKFDINDIAADARHNTVEDEVGGRKYFKSRSVSGPSFFMPNDTTLWIADQGMLKKQFAKDKKPAEGHLVEKVKARTGTEDFYIVFDVQALLPSFEREMAREIAQAPPEVQELLEARHHIKLAEFGIHLTTPGRTQLQLDAIDAAAADKLEALVNEAINKGTEQIKAQSRQMASSDDPYEAALGRYGLRVADKLYDPSWLKRNGEDFVLLDVDLDDPNVPQLMAAITGVSAALLVPGLQGARAAAQQNQAMNNMKMLLLSLHNYESSYRRLPAHASYDDDGKPLLSWRVHMLPFLDEQALYDEFHLDEPWDSEHNKQLIAKMPKVFLSPKSTHTAEQGLSNYVAPVGEEFLFDGTEAGTPLRRVTDGLSNTIALLEVNDEHAVPWTAPEDWEYDEENPTKGLFGLHTGGAAAGWADGHVDMLSEDIDFETLLALLTKAGGEIVNEY